MKLNTTEALFLIDRAHFQRVTDFHWILCNRSPSRTEPESCEMYASVIILLITYGIELLFGVFLIALAYWSDISEEGKDKARLQLLLTGVSDIFSAILMFVKARQVYSGDNSAELLYLQWGVCTPLMIIVLCVLCHLPWETTVTLALLDAVMIFCGYLGSVTPEAPWKFTYFAMGSVIFVSLWSVMLWGRFIANRKGLTTSTESSLSLKLIILTIGSWAFYPLFWLIEELQFISDTYTLDIIHSALSICAKIIFSLVLAWYRSAVGQAYGPLSYLFKVLYHNRAYSSKVTPMDIPLTS
ncbi:sensory rhodopsin (SRI) [Planoprotostelium fungivorum]|uniref:Sensory rhodopsin (SRI) n=1 Tax=Planoprotostelium fungivorum TaxID=1890364 RepID=A0A2P6NAM3_9EUKA|nr:sensory rhodopsin (SRI) [Planoprotostelium fungivorum]